MQVQHPIFHQISTLKDLPTLPHVLVKLLNACNKDDENLDVIAEIISKDPSLSAKVLRLVNSAYHGLSRKLEDIRQAVVLVGIKGVKNLAFCAGVFETFKGPSGQGVFDLKRFWWHSLRCAFLSRAIAEKTGYGHPDEAFLSGLLHDIGKLVFWVNFRKEYEGVLRESGNDPRMLLEGEARLGATHCEVGAWLLKRWDLQSVISDAVLYHHDSPERIRQSFPLVQIVYTANTLCQDWRESIEKDSETARGIVGLESDETQGIFKKSEEEAREAARSLAIDPEAMGEQAGPSTEKDQGVREALVQEVGNVSLLVGTLEAFLEAEDRNAILLVLDHGLKALFDVKRSLFFLMDHEKDALFACLPDREGRYASNTRFSVSLDMDKSLLVRTLQEDRALDSFSANRDSTPMILDEQIIRLLGKEGVFCYPMAAMGDLVGVLAVGVDRSELSHLTGYSKLLKVFVHKGALALRMEQIRRERLQTIRAERVGASSDLARKIIHEVNNPLGIIKNYLKILGMKLAEQEIAGDEIRIINEEIDRVVHLLKELSAFSRNSKSETESVDVNALLLDILRITRETLLKESNVEIQADLERAIPKVSAEKNGLKQVFINLIKNAAEAMEAGGSGGNIHVKTRHVPGAFGIQTSREGGPARGCVEILFKDSGPGIPEEIREKLFDPYVSSKGNGHSGLGLSIVHNIITSFHGKITCESQPDEGTVFTIELPAVSD